MGEITRNSHEITISELSQNAPTLNTFCVLPWNSHERWIQRGNLYDLHEFPIKSHEFFPWFPEDTQLTQQDSRILASAPLGCPKPPWDVWQSHQKWVMIHQWSPIVKPKMEKPRWMGWASMLNSMVYSRYNELVNGIINQFITYDWLVVSGGWALPLWKMMDFVSGVTTFPIWWET